MSTVQQEPTRLQRVRMSWDDYLALPDDLRAEYVDGVALMAPLASFGHNRAGVRLFITLESHLDALFVVTEAGWLHQGRMRIPDVAAWNSPVDLSSRWTERVPTLVVEVLSPSTRREDTTRKSAEYLAAGVGHYWILDRDRHAFTALGNASTQWEVLLELDDDHPTGEVTVGEHGTVAIDLAALLAP